MANMVIGGRGGLTVVGVDGGMVDWNYATAKISVWWNIENCPPEDIDAHVISKNIRSTLIAKGYHGPICISAYGDINLINTNVQQALFSTGISLCHVPGGVKDASVKKILADMLFWADDNQPPANYLLISGNCDFSYALHQLSMRRYNILLTQPRNISHALTYAGKIVWSLIDLPAVCDAVLKFLSSPDGHSSMMASRCMYDAASILKRSCLKDCSLGEVLRILNEVIHHKKWILPHSSGWQPLSLLLPSDMDGKPDTTQDQDPTPANINKRYRRPSTRLKDYYT